MKHFGGTSIALAGALAFACAAPPTTESEKAGEEFQKLAVSAVPTDVRNPTFVDFGGKVHLLGWEVSPQGGTAAPGSAISAKFYWRAVKKVPSCYRLYTHLTAPDGTVSEFDGVGPLRVSSATENGDVPSFPPSAWTPGTVYVDEQRLVVPQGEAPGYALSVGVSCPELAEREGKLEKVGDFKLAVLSGVADGKEGALVGRFTTGAKRGDKSKDNGRRRMGQRPGGDRRPGTEPLGRGPMGRVPGAERENPQ